MGGQTEILFLKAQFRHFLCYIHQTENPGNALGYDRGVGCSGGSPVKYNNKQQIQHHI